MSLLEVPSSALSSTLRPDELEDAFRAWAEDPAKPDVVSYYMRGLARLDSDLRPITSYLGASVQGSRGDPDVR